MSVYDPYLYLSQNVANLGQNVMSGVQAGQALADARTMREIRKRQFLEQFAPGARFQMTAAEPQAMPPEVPAPPVTMPSTPPATQLPAPTEPVFPEVTPEVMAQPVEQPPVTLSQTSQDMLSAYGASSAGKLALIDRLSQLGVKPQETMELIAARPSQETIDKLLANPDIEIAPGLLTRGYAIAQMEQKAAADAEKNRIKLKLAQDKASQSSNAAFNKLYVDLFKHMSNMSLDAEKMAASQNIMQSFLGKDIGAKSAEEIAKAAVGGATKLYGTVVPYTVESQRLPFDIFNPKDPAHYDMLADLIDEFAAPGMDSYTAANKLREKSNQLQKTQPAAKKSVQKTNAKVREVLSRKEETIQKAFARGMTAGKIAELLKQDFPDLAITEVMVEEMRKK